MYVPVCLLLRLYRPAMSSNILYTTSYLHVIQVWTNNASKENYSLNTGFHPLYLIEQE